MSGVFFIEDIVTLTICLIIFWGVVGILTLYPYLQERKVNKRTSKLEKNDK